jgi:hypothetical protein
MLRVGPVPQILLIKDRFLPSFVKYTFASADEVRSPVFYEGQR